MTPKITPFQQYVAQYEAWFHEHHWAYQAELRAVQQLMPAHELGLEIGVGTGRFAVPLGIRLGVDPSPRMHTLAQQRGIHTVSGVAENLPFCSNAVDLALMVTTVCFVDDLDAALREVHRVLKQGGAILIGLVDQDSAVGRMYLAHQHESVFYREATFFSTDEIITAMRHARFTNFECTQTIFGQLQNISPDEPVETGYGRGSFVVVKGTKT